MGNGACRTAWRGHWGLVSEGFRKKKSLALQIPAGVAAEGAGNFNGSTKICAGGGGWGCREALKGMPERGKLFRRRNLTLQLPAGVATDLWRSVLADLHENAN